MEYLLYSETYLERPSLMSGKGGLFRQVVFTDRVILHEFKWSLKIIKDGKMIFLRRGAFPKGVFPDRFHCSYFIIP